MYHRLIGLFMVFFILCPPAESSERIHDGVVKIRLLQSKKEDLVSEEFKVNDPGKPTTNKSHYEDQYGLKTFFDYESPDSISELDLRIINGLGNYRKEHLDNSNPLIVRFKLHTNYGPVNLYVGLFVSGSDDYALKKNSGALVSINDLLYSENFKINISCNFKNKQLVPKGDVELGKNDSLKKLVPVLNNRDVEDTNMGKFVDIVTQSYLASIEEKVKQAILQEKENSIKKELQQYKSISSMYKVPNFQTIGDSLPLGIFPITLTTIERLYNNNGTATNTEKHFIDVVERIFEWNLRSFRKHGSKSSPFQRLSHLMVSNPPEKKLCFNLFGRNHIDGDGKDGCFDSSFDYYFSDSEQAFLEWLNAIGTQIDLGTGAGIDDFPYSVFSLDDGSLPFLKIPPDSSPSTQTSEDSSSAGSTTDSVTEQPATTVNKIEIEFLSYLDMCHACRGTFSYLMKSWVQPRVEKFVKAWFQHNDRSVNITGGQDIIIWCLSKEICNKGEQS